MQKKIKDIGELGLIRKLSQAISTDKSVIKGIGDDAAVIKFTANKYLLFKTDMVVEGEHFTRKMPARLIGRKALARNISDIAAMGGIPTYAVISLGIPPLVKATFVMELFQGINEIAKKFHINIVGGDTSKASKTFISIALLGWVEKSKLVLRSTARKGDLIFVTGNLGASFKTGKHLNFTPRIKESRFLVGKYKPTAMIDISDGLVLDLHHILEASRCGAFIYEEFIPRAPKAGLHNALYDGEDYELLFTLPGTKAARLIRNLRKSRHKFPISCIGELVDKKCGLIFIDSKYRLSKLAPRGFTHF
jgi:thiamine-monophosphate kinase